VTGSNGSTKTAREIQVISRAFGEDNRKRLLERYFSSAEVVTPHNAWLHIYRLLLWVDPTTGLAHCYESDKAQPGRPWYARSLAFHSWVARQLDTTSSDLAGHIDQLFRWATSDLAAATVARRATYAAEAERQRAPYADQELPLPGEDPDLIELVVESLRPWLSSEPPAEILRDLTERIRAHVGQENKRKNLVGEGFEDTLAAILTRVRGVGDRYDVRVRPWLSEIPGFHEPRRGEKPRQVDLALIRRADGYRTLVSCKWSVRSDREEQFGTDFDAYARLESANQAFDYVLVTNEFDPARLAAACENRRGPNLLFSEVVHVAVEGLRATYAAPIPQRGRGVSRALDHVAGGRLGSMDSWLRLLVGERAE
jgi:hypothetical protein